jgi:hypothetical protein
MRTPYIFALKPVTIFANTYPILKVVLIADKKRKENISEYIVHMYKTEDLLRAFEFDVDQVDKYMIAHLPLTDEEKVREKEWYRELIIKMKSDEGLKSGHLIEVQEIVSDLEVLHQKLYDSDTDYRKVIEGARKDLDQYTKLANDDTMGEVQLCLNAVYGYLLLKIENKPIFDSQKDTVEKFGTILAYLSLKYGQRGE